MLTWSTPTAAARTSRSRCARRRRSRPASGALGFLPGNEYGCDRQNGVLESMAIGLQRTVEASTLILRGVGELIAALLQGPGAELPVAGPLGIADLVGGVRESAPPAILLWLVGLLSANLAVFNILPFPPMDGGRMTMALVQAASRNRVSPATERLVYLTGFVMLMTLLVDRDLVGHPADGHVSAPAGRARRQTPTVDVGGVAVGSAAPIVVQSMTNTDTADADATALQVAALAHAGSELVRITVNNDAAAAAVPLIRRKLDDLGIGVPLVGDFHYNGHQLLRSHPAAAAALAKYRINPGNVGGKRRDEHFATIVRVAIEHDKPVRIGVNWGSLDQDLLTELMEANARSVGAAGRTRRAHGGHAGLDPALGGAGGGHGPGARPHHPQRQGQRRRRPRGHLP